MGRTVCRLELSFVGWRQDLDRTRVSLAQWRTTPRFGQPTLDRSGALV